MKLALGLLIGVSLALIVTVLLRWEGRPRDVSRLPLHFDHGFHMSVACNTCHHNFAVTEARFAALPDQRCIACHLALPDQEAIIETTFHKFCEGCHQREKLAGNPTGPLRDCQTCHIRTPSTDILIGTRSSLPRMSLP